MSVSVIKKIAMPTSIAQRGKKKIYKKIYKKILQKNQSTENVRKTTENKWRHIIFKKNYGKVFSSYA